MLLPAILILGLLFGGGLAMALVQSLGDFPPTGEHPITLAHHRALLSDPELRISIAITFLWATIATGISTAAGFALALAFRNLARGSRLLSGLLQTPVAIPHLAMAVFVINLIGQSGLSARMAPGFAPLLCSPMARPSSGASGARNLAWPCSSCRGYARRCSFVPVRLIRSVEVNDDVGPWPAWHSLLASLIRQS
jgi:hypothetical protein